MYNDEDIQNYYSAVAFRWNCLIIWWAGRYLDLRRK